MSAVRVYATVRLAVDVDGLASADLVGDILHDALVCHAVLDSIREDGLGPDQLEWETEADALRTQGCEADIFRADDGALVVQIDVHERADARPDGSPILRVYVGEERVYGEAPEGGAS